MSELDIEALKLLQKAIEDDWPLAGKSNAAMRQLPAIVAALEDCERLMNGVRAVHNAVLAGGPEWRTNRDAALFDLVEILAALEGRDG